MERDHPMDETQRVVIVASDNKKRRSLLKAAVEQAGYHPKVLGSSLELCRMPPTPLTTLLETDDDVARLCQIVYELDREHRIQQVYLTVFGFLSTDAMNRNPSINNWCIGNAAALVALWDPDDREVPSYLATMLKRIDANRCEHQARTSASTKLGR
jgi:hypothetical protein